MSTVLANTITAVGGGGSTVKVNNDSTYISEGGAVTDSNLVQGLCKVWCYWENSDTVRDSFNSSGLTDNGSGDATYSYTNNMANDDYASFLLGMVESMSLHLELILHQHNKLVIEIPLEHYKIQINYQVVY